MINNIYELEKKNKYNTNCDTDNWCLSSPFNSYKEYTKNGLFEKINDFLRYGITDDIFIENYIRNLDKLFETLPQKLRNTVPLEVYRGVKLNPELEQLINGKLDSDIYVDKGFVSTSKSKSIAKQFMGEKGVLFHIIIPRNSVIIDDEKLPSYARSFMKTEQEVLLPRNAQFKILSYNPKTGIVEAEYIGQKQPLEMPQKIILQTHQEIFGEYNKILLNKKVPIDDFK